MKNIIKAAVRKVKEKVAAVKAKVCGFVARVRGRIGVCAARTRVMFASCRGENFVDSGIKILIAVVIGALLLAGLYALFGDTIMPTVTQKVKDMFNFKG